jgi:7-cyano-7-deazaguanine synthase
MQTDSSSPQAPVARHTAALVLFSGGQDSTTCLAQALSLYERVETLGFDYGQRHSVEMQVRQQVRERLARDFPQWAPRLGEDHVLSLDVLQQIGGSSLTEDVAFAMQADGLPNTFVPGRNLLFLTLAGALATGAACR